jgi:hypothetical protein
MSLTPPNGTNTVFTRVKIAALVVGMMAATATVVAAWPQRYWVAHRGYVDDVVDQRIAPIVPTVKELTKWRIEDSIAKLDSEIANWQIKLPTETDGQTRQMIQNRITEITAKETELKKQAAELVPPR